MPRKKTQRSQSPSLKEFLDTYDQHTLVAALNTLEGALGWEVFKAYAHFVQRNYEVDALDLITKQDMVQAASYASGYAKCADDLSASFIEGLRETISGRSKVLETARPEE